MSDTMPQRQPLVSRRVRSFGISLTPPETTSPARSDHVSVQVKIPEPFTSPGTAITRPITAMTTQPPLVSIAIPTYNRADLFLPQALASALAQDYQNLEILVSDNASGDTTPQLLSAHADPRLRYVRQPHNLGAQGNFQYCVNNARGDYLLLLHDDDVLDADCISSCMREANFRTDFGLIRTGTRIIDAQGQVIRAFENQTGALSTRDYLMAWFKGRSAWYLCSDLFNLPLLRDIGGLSSPYNLLQDGVAITHLLQRAPRADVSAVKASFRKHAGEITFSGSSVRDWCRDYDYLRTLLRQYYPDDEMLYRAATQHFSQSCMQLARAARSPGQRLTAKMAVWQTFGWKSWVRDELTRAEAS